MEPFCTLTSRTVVLPSENIDTDQIIPARFLKATTRDGLGSHLFADWRYDRQGNPRSDFVLHRPEAAGAEILVAGGNFGCGSSREHAAWALLDYGIRAVVSTSIADIFTNNALKNGLLPVVVDEPMHRFLLSHPGTMVTIDIESSTLEAGEGGKVIFPIDPFARYCLLRGIDQLDFLLQQEPSIAAFEKSFPGAPHRAIPVFDSELPSR